MWPAERIVRLLTSSAECFAGAAAAYVPDLMLQLAASDYDRCVTSPNGASFVSTSQVEERGGNTCEGGVTFGVCSWQLSP
jgi:hypothetical protein